MKFLKDLFFKWRMRKVGINTLLFSAFSTKKQKKQKAEQLSIPFIPREIVSTGTLYLAAFANSRHN